jgi:hypothetical protein
MSVSNHILPSIISRLAPYINQIVADNHYGFQGSYRLFIMCCSYWRASGVRPLSSVDWLIGMNCCSVLSLNSVYPLFNSNTGRFVMLSVITNIYNKKTNGPLFMELFTATGKLKNSFLTTREVWCVHHGWHGTHPYHIQVLATHVSTWLHRYSSLLQWSVPKAQIIVWQELECRIDVCLVTRGAHIEHL